jgi:hypothetical protein
MFQTETNPKGRPFQDIDSAVDIPRVFFAGQDYCWFEGSGSNEVDHIQHTAALVSCDSPFRVVGPSEITGPNTVVMHKSIVSKINEKTCR